jgi:hypothetical protein
MELLELLGTRESSKANETRQHMGVSLLAPAHTKLVIRRLCHQRPILQSMITHDKCGWWALRSNVQHPWELQRQGPIVVRKLDRPG